MQKLLINLYHTTVHIHWQSFDAQRYARENAGRLFRQLDDNLSVINLPRDIKKYRFADGSYWLPSSALGRIVGVWGDHLVYEPTSDFLKFCSDNAGKPDIPTVMAWHDMPDWVVCVVDYIPTCGISYYGADESIIFMDG